MDNEAVTVIAAMIDTGGALVEIPLRLVGEVSADMLRNIFSALWYAGKQSMYIQNTTRRGACSMDYLITNRGTELQYCRIPNELKEDFLKDLEARGGLYTILPDLNTADDYFEIAFHTTDTPKVNAACVKYHIGETQDASVAEGIIGMADYVNNASPEQMESIEAEYSKELGLGKKADAPGEYTLTINKEKLLAGEDKTHYFTYVPGTYEKKAGGFQELIAVPKSASAVIHDGQSIEYTLGLNKEYKVYDGSAYRLSGEFSEKDIIKGSDLAKHYHRSRGTGSITPEKSEGRAENKVGETVRGSTEKEVDNYQKTPYKRADGFHNFEQRNYDYDSLTLEFVQRLQAESQIKKVFTDDDIQYMTDRYYLLRPEVPEGGMLVIPKDDVVYDPQNQTYQAVLKDKDYHRLSEKQFSAGDVDHPEIIDKQAAAKHMELLDAVQKSQDEKVQEKIFHLETGAETVRKAADHISETNGSRSL